jgi:hypothetical protein
MATKLADYKVESVKNDHSCCQTDAKKPAESPGKPLKSYALGVMAAVVACVCCYLPLIPLMLGLSGASVINDQLRPYHLAFEVTGMMILLGACGYMWSQHRKSGRPLHSFWLLIVVTFAMYGLLTFIMKKVVAPTFLSTGWHPATHDSHRN